jgi:hypothetical protein
MNESDQDHAYTITYTTSDSVSSDEMGDDMEGPGPLTPQQAATYGLERLLNHAGPDLYYADVVDEDGVTHHLELWRRDDGWSCEERMDDSPDESQE